MILRDVVNSWRQQPFERGVSDCCAFVNYVLEKMHGEVRLPFYRDNYQEIIDLHGTLCQAVTHYAERPFIDDPDKLMPGDVVLIEIYDEQTIGILMENEKVAVVFEGHGLRLINDAFVDGGWSWA